MIKNIIFDAGGVLFKTDWGAVKKDIRKKYGFSIFLYSDYPKKIQDKFTGKLTTGHLSFRDALKEVSGKKNIKEIAEAYKKSYCKHQKLNRPLVNLVKKLSKNYEMYYLTNTHDLSLEANRESGLFNIFKKGYGSCEIGFKKPDRRSFNFLLKKHQLKPRETLFIDDKERNLIAARKLGMKTILFEDNKRLILGLKKLGVNYG
jgi:putative hydrolase of the HAD superfamily